MLSSYNRYKLMYEHPTLKITFSSKTDNVQCRQYSSFTSQVYSVSNRMSTVVRECNTEVQYSGHTEHNTKWQNWQCTMISLIKKNDWRSTTSWRGTLRSRNLFMLQAEEHLLAALYKVCRGFAFSLPRLSKLYGRERVAQQWESAVDGRKRRGEGHGRLRPQGRRAWCWCSRSPGASLSAQWPRRLLWRTLAPCLEKPCGGCRLGQKCTRGQKHPYQYHIHSLSFEFRIR